MSKEHVLGVLVPRRENVVTWATEDGLVVHADWCSLEARSGLVGVYLQGLGGIADTPEEAGRNDVRFDQVLLGLAVSADHAPPVRLTRSRQVGICRPVY